METNENSLGCDFLRNLSEAVVTYSQTVCPKEHAWCFSSCYTLPSDLLMDNLLKVQFLETVHYLTFKVFKTLHEFQKEVQTKTYVHNSHNVATFFDGDCLHFILCWLDNIPQRVVLIHPEDENKNMIVPQDGTRIRNSQEELFFNKYGFFLFNLQW